MTAAETHLAARDLEVAYGPAKALHGVSIEVGKGSVTALLGPNGAGKSTFARAVSGLVPVQGGSCHFQGVNITGWAAHRIRRAGLVHVPEGRGIFPGLSVLDNLLMAVGTSRGRRQRAEQVERAFDLFPKLASRRHQRAASMSGGEQQMLALGRAMAVQPSLIVADELSLGLAPLIVEEVFASLETARREGVTVILIEQFIHRALAFADRCAIVARGRIVWSGSADVASSEVLDRYMGGHAPA